MSQFTLTQTDIYRLIAIIAVLFILTLLMGKVSCYYYENSTSKSRRGSKGGSSLSLTVVGIISIVLITLLFIMAYMLGSNKQNINANDGTPEPNVIVINTDGSSSVVPESDAQLKVATRPFHVSYIDEENPRASPGFEIVGTLDKVDKSENLSMPDKLNLYEKRNDSGSNVWEYISIPQDRTLHARYDVVDHQGRKCSRSPYCQQKFENDLVTVDGVEYKVNRFNT